MTFLVTQSHNSKSRYWVPSRCIPDGQQEVTPSLTQSKNESWGDEVTCLGA